MRVFVTGGSGQTGPAIVSELIRGGHEVVGLARSEASAATLEKLGVREVVRGSLEDLDVLKDAARDADGVVHMAYGGDFADPESMVRRDVDAITAFGEALEGTDKPLVITSGTLVMPAGTTAAEDRAASDGPAAFRVAGEDACLALADRGVRAVVLRLAPTVHGPKDHGFVPGVVAAAKKNGVSAYVGDGANVWPAVNREDVAVLFRLALEKAPAGSILHAVAENVAFKNIAETIGTGLGLETVSVTPEQAVEHFGNPFMAMLYGSDVPASSERTQEHLDWHPEHIGLLEDLREGDYLS